MNSQSRVQSPMERLVQGTESQGIESQSWGGGVFCPDWILIGKAVQDCLHQVLGCVVSPSPLCGSAMA